MKEQPTRFKVPPKKFHPKGVSILYEDQDILVVDKIHGLLTVGNEKIREKTAYFLLNDYVKRDIKSRDRIFIVHRLDRDTSGVIVFAKNEQSKHYLQDEWQRFEKTYFAVVHGILPEKEGMITSYLCESNEYKVFSVRDRSTGKLAKTQYKVLRESPRYSLLEIHLLTGRKNQIRVHFSEKGYPVAGDKKYGGKEKGITRLALHAASLTLLHPSTKEKMTFETRVPEYFDSLVPLPKIRTDSSKH